MKTSLFELSVTDQKSLLRLVKREKEEVTTIIEQGSLPKSSYYSHLEVLERQLSNPINGLSKEVDINKWLNG